MNLIKHLEFFDPTKIKAPIHIIGCGAIGSTAAEMLVRLGFDNLHLYDFDIVDEHNITNQMFRTKDIGTTKVTALTEILKEINPEVQIKTYPRGYEDTTNLRGIVFIAVDSIDLRKKIVSQQQYNRSISFVIDCRMELTSAQMYATTWDDKDDIKKFLGTMNFTDEEAKEATPVSACGTTLSVTPTVRSVVSIAISNLINYFKTNTYKTMAIIDPFNFNIVCFPE